MESTWKAHLPRAAWVALLVLTLAGALQSIPVVVSGARMLVKRYPLCPTELYVLEGMQTVADGRPLYPEVTGLPFVFRIYHPLAYALVGWSARLLGVDLHDVDRGLPFSRWPSVVASLLLLALLGVFFYRRARPPLPLALLLPVLLALLHASTMTEFFRNRPEPAGLLFTFLGWVLAQERATRGWPILASLCFVVALLFKQTLLAAPLATLVELALARESRPAAGKLALWLLGLGALALAWCVGGNGSDYFSHAVFPMASNPLRLSEGPVHFLGVLASRHWGPFVLASFLFAVAWLIWRRQERGLLIYLAVCLVITVLSSAKTGAHLYYYSELSILLVLALAFGVADLLRRRSWLTLVPLLGLALHMGVSEARHGHGWNRACISRTEPAGCRDAELGRESPMRSYEQRYREDRGATLVLHEELAVRLGRVALLDSFMLKLLVDAGYLPGVLRPEALEREVISGRHPRILFSRNLNPWTRGFLRAALRHGYRVTWDSPRIVELTRR